MADRSVPRDADMDRLHSEMDHFERLALMERGLAARSKEIADIQMKLDDIEHQLRQLNPVTAHTMGLFVNDLERFRF